MTETTTPPRSRVALSKADLQTDVAIDLLRLCQGVTADGQLTQDELTALQDWIDHHDRHLLPAIEFLDGIVRQVLAHGKVTDEALKEVYKAIEKVLPSELRQEASQHRRIFEVQEKAKKAELKATEKELQKRTNPVASSNFMVAGTKHEGRGVYIKHYAKVDSRVFLVRDRSNKFSSNAIEVRLNTGNSIGFVPEEDARRFAKLFDSGHPHIAYITKMLDRADPPIPIVQAYIYDPETVVEGVTFEKDLPAKRANGCLGTACMILASAIGMATYVFT